MSVDQKSTKIVTGVVRLSYAKIWEPEADDKGVLKYSTSILIPKSDKKTIADIKNAIEAAKLAGKDKLGNKAGVIKTPLRDGDEERPDDAAYAGHYFLNASTTHKPGIVDRSVKPIMDRDEVYSGCYVRASLNFYAFNVGANKGIAVGLNNIMKWEDGEPLGGGKSKAEDDFAAFATAGGEADDLF